MAFVSGSPFLVAATARCLFVWNVLTLSVWWSYALPIAALAVDPASPHFAVLVRQPLAAGADSAASEQAQPAEAEEAEEDEEEEVDEKEEKAPSKRNRKGKRSEKKAEKKTATAERVPEAKKEAPESKKPQTKSFILLWDVTSP